MQYEYPSENFNEAVCENVYSVSCHSKHGFRVPPCTDLFVCVSLTYFESTDNCHETYNLLHSLGRIIA